jgi:hypothetical protein
MSKEKTKVVGVRLPEAIYKEIEKQASERGNSISQYIRELVYSFYYPAYRLQALNKLIEVKGSKTSEFAEALEERKAELEKSIEQSRGYLGKLEGLEKVFNEMLADVKELIKKGVKEFETSSTKK